LCPPNGSLEKFILIGVPFRYREFLMDKDARFWSKIAEKYAAAPVPSEEIYQKKLAVTRKYLRPDMEVLEFGCGTGTTALAHAAYFVTFWPSTSQTGCLRSPDRKLKNKVLKMLILS
jgi:cyclopropane fatty-acyl-phospholipid synthase-like methyltransferase